MGFSELSNRLDSGPAISALMDPAYPPLSTNYDLYPGFWYTLEAGTAECTELSCFAATYGLTSADASYNFACDFDHDGDVDGAIFPDQHCFVGTTRNQVCPRNSAGLFGP